ncbi:hypothetical protein BJ166DRAFT_590506 [Pestalotiopsis sp. NC0098]|nr:hypothetical protein BJ166DRAFT_590506 [Pestalotiopsis sp. NC0098]
MSSGTNGKHEVNTTQRSFNSHCDTDQALLREERLNSYLNEGISDGNHLARLTTQTTQKSDTFMRAAAEVHMVVKIHNIMEPFYNAKKGY